MGRKLVGGSELRFLIIIMVLVPFISCGSRVKYRLSPLASTLRANSITQKAPNSTRNARQTPEIPALYSAPKIPTPEIPALYSAPEQFSPDSLNEVDSSSDRATTEISVEEMDDEMEEETSSEDVQYGVPTEKYPEQDEDKTDSPMATLRTNEVDDEGYSDHTDSYNSGYADQPSSVYGPPDGKGKSAKDQQQMENNMQEMSQMGDNQPESQYLPPQHIPTAMEQPSDNSGYNDDLSHYQQPPNPNYKTLPEAGGNGMGNGYPGENYLPPQQPQFGRDAKPSAVYGPPNANHLGSGPGSGSHDTQQEELEGLNEKIVDAEMLERVQQIIEEHEMEQKRLLEASQKDSGSPGYSTASGQGYSGNELGFSSPSDSSYSGFGNPSGFSGYNGASQQYGPPSFTSSQPQSQDQARSQSQPNRNPQTNNNAGRQEGSHEPSFSPNVEYQKAILSTHFTESQPAPQSSYKGNDQLNSFAGPGQEYLPPPSSSKPQPTNSGSQGYAATPPSEYGVPPRNQNQNSQKGSSNMLADKPDTKYGPPKQNTDYNNSPSKQQPSGPAPAFWSRNQSPEPQTRYGPPTTANKQSDNGFRGQSQIKYSSDNIFGDNASQPQPNYGPPQYTTKAPGNMVSEPRPIYGIPLAPVIGLDSGSPTGSYLPPSHFQPMSYNFEGPTPSASSNFLSIQGQPGLSNTFSLPIYDYMSHLLGTDLTQGESSSSPSVLPLSQILEQLPLSSMDNLPTIIYTRQAKDQDGVRVSRRAVNNHGTVTPANPNSSRRSNSSRKSANTNG